MHAYAENKIVATSSYGHLFTFSVEKPDPVYICENFTKDLN